MLALGSPTETPPPRGEGKGWGANDRVIPATVDSELYVFASAAKQSSVSRRPLDCFAALAKTVSALTGQFRGRAYKCGFGKNELAAAAPPFENGSLWPHDPHPQPLPTPRSAVADFDIQVCPSRASPRWVGRGAASRLPRLGLMAGCSRGRIPSELDDPSRRRCAAPQDEGGGSTDSKSVRLTTPSRALHPVVGRRARDARDVRLGNDRNGRVELSGGRREQHEKGVGVGDQRLKGKCT